MPIYAALMFGLKLSPSNLSYPVSSYGDLLKFSWDDPFQITYTQINVKSNAFWGPAFSPLVVPVYTDKILFFTTNCLYQVCI